MKKIRFLLPLLFLILAGLSCSSGDDTGSGQKTVHLETGDCNYFSMGDCLTPFPSNQFLKESANGKYVYIPEEDLPSVREDPAYSFIPAGTPFPSDYLRIFDGFSPATSILLTLNGRINKDDRFPDILHPDRSLQKDSSIQLIDTTTGERILLFAEGDSRSDEERHLLIHPLVRLQPSTTYIVVIMNDAVADASQPVTFTVLRDSIPTDNDEIESIRKKFEGYFELTDRLSIPRKDIFLMWDFTTGSDANIIDRNLGRIREFVASLRVTDYTLDVTLSVDFPDRGDGDFLYRLVRGRMEVPWLLYGGNLRINRKADGGVDTENYSTSETDFVVLIPRCVTTSAQKPLVMFFGHGLGGNLNDSYDYLIREDAENWCSIVIATNWYGSNQKALDDVIFGWAGLYGNPFVGFVTMSERLLQGHLNYLMLVRRVYEILALSGLSGNPDDYANIFYYGVSNGGFQGGTLAWSAYESGYMDTFALNVNGAKWSFIFQRLVGWTDLENIFLFALKDRYEITKLLVLSQFFYDFIDPLTFAPYYDLAGEHILSQESMGDPAVSNIATELWARSAGLPGLKYLLDDPLLIEEKSAPLTSALTQWDGHPDILPPLKNSPITGNQLTEVLCGTVPVSAHGVPLCLDVAREQVGEFARDKVVNQLCSDSKCDPR